MSFDPTYAGYAAALGECGTESDLAAIEAQHGDDPAESTNRKGGPWLVKHQPSEVCPITALHFSYGEGRYRSGALVHPLAYDELGYQELPAPVHGPTQNYKPSRPRPSLTGP